VLTLPNQRYLSASSKACFHKSQHLSHSEYSPSKASAIINGSYMAPFKKGKVHRGCRPLHGWLQTDSSWMLRKQEPLWIESRRKLSLMGDSRPCSSTTVSAADMSVFLGVVISSEIFRGTCPTISDNCVVTNTHSTVTQLQHFFMRCDLRLDYCNVVFAGRPRPPLTRLQRLLNAAALVVSDSRKFDQRDEPLTALAWCAR